MSLVIFGLGVRNKWTQKKPWRPQEMAAVWRHLDKYRVLKPLYTVEKLCPCTLLKIYTLCTHLGSNVLVMDTTYDSSLVSSTLDRKPHMILDYNKLKGWVHTLSKLTVPYSFKKKMPLWPLASFFNITEISEYNAFVIWKKINLSRQTGVKNRS